MYEIVLPSGTRNLQFVEFGSGKGSAFISNRYSTLRDGGNMISTSPSWGAETVDDNSVDDNSEIFNKDCFWIDDNDDDDDDEGDDGDGEDDRFAFDLDSPFIAAIAAETSLRE